MKIPKVSNGQAQILIGLAGLAVALYAVYASKSAIVNGAKAVGTAINPADPENLANKAVTSVGKAVSGNDNWSLGVSIYDYTHNNGPARQVDSVGKKISGDSNWSLGTWFYDVTHPAATGFNTTSVNLRK